MAGLVQCNLMHKSNYRTQRRWRRLRTKTLTIASATVSVTAMINYNYLDNKKPLQLNSLFIFIFGMTHRDRRTGRLARTHTQPSIYSFNLSVLNERNEGKNIYDDCTRTSGLELDWTMLPILFNMVLSCVPLWESVRSILFFFFCWFVVVAVISIENFIRINKHSGSGDKQTDESNEWRKKHTHNIVNGKRTPNAQYQWV